MHVWIKIRRGQKQLLLIFGGMVGIILLIIKKFTVTVSSVRLELHAIRSYDCLGHLCFPGPTTGLDAFIRKEGRKERKKKERQAGDLGPTIDVCTIRCVLEAASVTVLS